MIGLEDRQTLVRDINEAHRSGARLHQACETAGIDVRTLQRWKAGTGQNLDLHYLLLGQHRRTKPPSSSQAGQFYSGAVGQYYSDGNTMSGRWPRSQGD